jgi:hypothetical protein
MEAWIATRSKNSSGRKAAMVDGSFVCKRHGPTAPVADSHGMRCGKCRSEQVAARRRRVKDILVREAADVARSAVTTVTTARCNSTI